MLNGQGGFVLFGVTDDGQIRGQQVSAQTQEEIAQELRKLEPPAFPDIELVTLDNGKTVIGLRVPGGGGPYTYDGRPYIRNGPTTIIMPQERYQRRLLERMHASFRWENQPTQGLTIGDLDADEIRRTIDASISNGRMEDPGTRDVTELLTGLGLIHNRQLLNAAVVYCG
jgi:ATP-dependent DNA helicase RecG